VGQLGGPVGPEKVEELPQRVLVAAGRGPHQPAGVMVDEAGQVPLTLAVGDLIDPDPPQPAQQVPFPGLLSHHPGDDP